MGETPSVLSQLATGEYSQEALVVKKVLTHKDLALDYPYQVDILFTKRLTLFVGDPKSAKSLTAIYLGVCVAGNRDFLGFATRYGPVYYVNNEHSEEDDHERWIDKFKLGLNLPSSIPFYSSTLLQYNDLTNKNQAVNLLSVCKSLGVILLMVDNLGSSIGSQKEENHIAQRLFSNLNLFCDQGIAVALIHHFKKGEKIYRGPTSIPASVDRVFSFSPVSLRDRLVKDDEGNTQWLTLDTPLTVKVLLEFGLACVNSRKEWPPDLLIGIDENDLTGATKLVQRGPFIQFSPVQELKDRIMWYFGLNLGMGFTVKELSEGVGGDDAKDIREARKELVTEGKVEYREQGKRLRLFETGMKSVSAPLVIGFEENLTQQVATLCQKYQAEDKHVIPIKSGFVDVLGEDLPELAGMGANGASARVKKVLVGMGYLVDDKGTGGWLRAYI